MVVVSPLEQGDGSIDARRELRGVEASDVALRVGVVAGVRLCLDFFPGVLEGVEPLTGEGRGTRD